MTLSLSIVIPVYNEPHWIEHTAADVVAAVEKASGLDAELVIVDDGSGPDTAAALDRIEAPFPVRVLRQENRGRFRARVAGIEAAAKAHVLLLDSRVSLHPDALVFVGPQVEDGRHAWNGHCMVDTDGNPYGRFWNVMSHLAFAAYLDDPRTTSFGLDDYDHFPKGTGHFLAPRRLLLEALDGFTSHYDDLRFVSDDTHLLRHIAEQERINISPAFASTYHARTALRPFLGQAYYRGTTFFDGFARSDTRFFPVLLAVLPASAVGAIVALRRPRLGAAGLGAIVLASAAIAARRRRPLGDVVAFAGLSVPFGIAYVAGIWRGLLLYLRASGSR